MFRGFHKNRVLWGDISKYVPCFSEYFAKSSRNLRNILGEQFVNNADSSRTVSLKTKRTIMNTGYANSSRALFEQLFANRIRETQTPVVNICLCEPRLHPPANCAQPGGVDEHMVILLICLAILWSVGDA